MQASPSCLRRTQVNLCGTLFVQRAPDGTFRMVWTWAWYKPLTIGYAESEDLLTWTSHRQLPVMANEPAAANVWAPALYYEAAKKQWLIFWASTIPGRTTAQGTGDLASAAGDGSNAIELGHRIYFTITPDFKTFTPAHIFFDPGYSVIDATLLPPPAQASRSPSSSRTNARRLSKSIY